jgi:outer membrane protein
MRSFLRTACATVAVLTPLLGFSNRAQAQQSQFKIAFVNMAILLDNAPGRTQAESTYARETRSYSDQLKKMNDSLNTLFTSYQKAEPTLTAAQKETRQKAMRDLQGALQDKQQQLSQQAQQRQNELMAPIMEQVKKVLDDIRTEDGYAMIITGDPNLILSYDKNLDITDRVVARLRTVASTPPPKTGAPVSAPAGVTRKPR